MIQGTWTRKASCSLGLVLLLATGCNYAQNRAKDFADIFGFGAGVGFGSNLRLTHYLQSSGPFLFTGPRARIMGRQLQGAVGPSMEAGLSPIVFCRSNTSEYPGGLSQSRAIIFGRTLVDTEKDRMWHSWYDSRIWSFYPGIREYEARYDRRLFDIGFSVYLILGFDFDFNPYELVDFFVGFFGADIGADDDAGAAPEEAPAVARS